MVVKNLFIFSLVAALAACSSSPKEEQAGGSMADASAPIVRETRPVTPAPVVKKEGGSKATPAVDMAVQLRDHMNRGEWSQVEHDASTMLSQNAQDKNALNALGLAAYRKNQFGAAIYFYERALKIDPRAAEVHNNKGLAQMSMGEDRQAILSFRKAIELNSSLTAAALNAGSYYLAKGDFSKAATAFEMGQKSSSGNVKFHNNFGLSLMGIDQNQKAKEQFELGLKLESSNKDIMLNYAGLLIERLNQYQAGLDVINRLKFLGPSTEVRARINSLENQAKTGLQ